MSFKPKTAELQGLAIGSPFSTQQWMMVLIKGLRKNRTPTVWDI